MSVNRRRLQQQLSFEILVRDAVWETLACQESVEKKQISVYSDGDITRVSIAHHEESAAEETLMCIRDDTDFVATFSGHLGGDTIVSLQSAAKIVEVLHIPPSPPSQTQTEITLGPTNVKTGDGDDSGGMSTGAMVGIIIGCTLAGMLLMAAAGYAYILMLRKKMSTLTMMKTSTPMAGDTSGKSVSTGDATLSAPDGEPTSSLEVASQPSRV